MSPDFGITTALTGYSCQALIIGFNLAPVPITMRYARKIKYITSHEFKGIADVTLRGLVDWTELSGIARK
jgi:hypothetical protein